MTRLRETATKTSSVMKNLPIFSLVMYTFVGILFLVLEEGKFGGRGTGVVVGRAS